MVLILPANFQFSAHEIGHFWGWKGISDRLRWCPFVLILGYLFSLAGILRLTLSEKAWDWWIFLCHDADLYNNPLDFGRSRPILLCEMGDNVCFRESTLPNVMRKPTGCKAVHRGCFPLCRVGQRQPPPGVGEMFGSCHRLRRGGCCPHVAPPLIDRNVFFCLVGILQSHFATHIKL